MDSNDKSTDSKELAVHYMTTLVDVARECFLILDSNLTVISANPIFYDTFKVLPEQTENKLLFELGNGQWNISELKTLLKEILPQKKVVKNYEVKHDFENIGQKTMVLNAKQIDSVQLIILAIEDISERKILEEKLAEYTKGLEAEATVREGVLTDRNKVLQKMNEAMVGREMKMIEQKKEIEALKKGK